MKKNEQEKKRLCVMLFTTTRKKIKGYNQNWDNLEGKQKIVSTKNVFLFVFKDCKFWHLNLGEH